MNFLLSVGTNSLRWFFNANESIYPHPWLAGCDPFGSHSCHPCIPVVVYKHLAKIEPQGRSSRFKAASPHRSRSSAGPGAPIPLIFSDWGCGCKEMAWCKLRRSWPSQMRSGQLINHFRGKPWSEMTAWTALEGGILQELYIYIYKLAIHVGNVPGVIDLFV